MKSSTVLEKALALLGNRGQRWIKGENSVEPGELYNGKIYAKRVFCSIGALEEIDPYSDSEAIGFLDLAIKPKRSVILFNDKKATTFPMVRKAFKKAIALAKVEGK